MATITTDLQISKNSTFTSLLVSENTAYAVSRSFVQDDLPYATTLYARVRHNHSTTGTSNWSDTVSFQVVQPAKIIGVCLNNSGTKGSFKWIDEYGNQLASFDFTSHPTYQGICMVTEDADRAPVTMTQFPLFYVKTSASGPSGTFASGKKCWWISDIATTGYRPHPAFKRTTSTSGGKYIISPVAKLGTYLCHTETISSTTCLGSKISQTVRASTTKANFKTYITNRNNTSAGISGFRMFDIWDMSLLRMLLLIAKADSDTQTVWGDNSAGTSYPKTGSTKARAVFQGNHNNPIVRIDDLWRCYWYHADCITVSSGVVTLTSPMDLLSTVVYGSSTQSRYTQPTSRGWIRDVLDCPMTIGNDTHDLLELFLPGQIVSSESQATFSDYHRDNQQTSQLLVGSTWYYGSDQYDSSQWYRYDSPTCPGIFLSSHNDFRDGHLSTGSRLSKS